MADSFAPGARLSHYRILERIGAGGMGEVDRAFEILDRAVERRDVGLWWILSDPDFGPLRDDPRFDALVRRIGLSP